MISEVQVAAMVLLAAMALVALLGLFLVVHVATRRAFRMLRAIQIAETAVDVARRYGGNAAPVEVVAGRLRDLKWEVGMYDAAGVPPVAEVMQDDAGGASEEEG